MNRSNSSGGLGCASVLTLIFIVLKLVGVIDWSWWWVLSPAWITAIITLMVITVFVVAYYKGANK